MYLRPSSGRDERFRIEGSESVTEVLTVCPSERAVFDKKIRQTQIVTEQVEGTFLQTSATTPFVFVLAFDQMYSSIRCRIGYCRA